MQDSENIEFIRNQKNDYYRLLQTAQKQNTKYEAQLLELQTVVSIAMAKRAEAEQDRDQMRAIMTQNITESNAKLNLYIENIQTLKATIKGLKQG